MSDIALQQGINMRRRLLLGLDRTGGRRVAYWGIAEPIGQCRIVETTADAAVDAALFARARLTVGVRVIGPAVIAEEGTSTIVPSGYGARVGSGGDIIIEEIEA